MKRSRRALVLAAVGGLCALAPAAQAETVDYYYGSPTNNVYWPYCGSPCYTVERGGWAQFLTESSARTVNTRTVCAATTDTSVVCSSDLAYHGYCGCTPRVAYSRSTYWNPVPQGRARAVW